MNFGEMERAEREFIARLATVEARIRALMKPAAGSTQASLAELEHLKQQRLLYLKLAFEFF